MAFKKNSPGCTASGDCNCGDEETCDIRLDDFEDATITDLTQTDGTWVESGGYIKTADDNARLDCDDLHPDAVPSHYVEILTQGADDGDQPRVYVGDHYAQLTIGSPNGCLSLYDSADTLLTTIRVDAAQDTEHTLKVWYGLTPPGDGGDSQFAAQLNGGEVLRKNVIRNGNGVALGTGTVTSEVRFNDFKYKKHWTADDTGCETPPAPDCDITSDNFTRANGSPGCPYDAIAGSGTIDTNKLKFTTTSSMLAVDTVHPQDAGTIQVIATGQGTNSGNQLIVATDADNGNFARLTLGAGGTLKLFTANVERRSVNFASAINTNYTITATQNNGVMSVQVGTGSNACLLYSVAAPATTRAGIGVGTVTGSVVYSALTIRRAANSDNPSCPIICDPCLICSGDLAVAWQVPISGVIQSTDVTCQNCSDCLDWNATHEIIYYTDLPGVCRWQIRNIVCVDSTLDLRRTTDLSGNWILELAGFTFDGSIEKTVFQYQVVLGPVAGNPSGVFDCTVPYVLTKTIAVGDCSTFPNFNPTIDGCDYSGMPATITITPVLVL